VLVVGRRLRRRSCDARCPRLPQGRPCGVGSCRARGLPIRARRARVGLLHRAGAGGDGSTTGDRPAARGDGGPRPDELGELRPALPRSGRASIRRHREPDRCAAAGSLPQGWGDRLSGRRDHGAARRPVGIPVIGVPDVASGVDSRRRRARNCECRSRGRSPHGADLDAHPTPAGAVGEGPTGCGHHAEPGRVDPGAARLSQARSVDAEPGVLRAAATPGLRLEGPAVHLLLRRDPGRPPGPSSRPG